MTVELKGLGKVTASKEVLNLLCTIAYDATEERENRHHYAIARQYKKVSDSIYDALDAVGYYNQVREG